MAVLILLCGSLPSHLIPCIFVYGLIAVHQGDDCLIPAAKSPNVRYILPGLGEPGDRYL